MDQHLAVFVAVAEKRSFSKAADMLHLTQPAVSQQIKVLEHHMGAQLLERSNKSVELTPAGAVVYEQAKEILGAYARMKALVDDVTQTAAGAISVGASYTYGEYILPHVIAKFRQAYPDILPTIRIGNTTEIAAAVQQRQIDVGIIEGQLSLDQVHAEPFAEDAMVVIASRNDNILSSGDSPVDAGRLQRQTWIVREPGSGTRAWEDHLFRELGFQPSVCLEFGSTQIIKEAVEAGLGIALLSNWTIQKELALGTLRIIQTDQTPLRRQFSLVLRQSSLMTRAMELFIDFVKAKGQGPSSQKL